MVSSRISKQALAPRLEKLGRRAVAGFQVPVASSFSSRLAGLSGLDLERAGIGLLIPRCSSIHTFGMRFPLEIYFLDRFDRVLRFCPAVPPRRFLGQRQATAVLELVPPHLLAHTGGESFRLGP